MPRLRNKATGVIVSVADGKTPAGYEPVEASEPKPAKKAAPRKAPSK